MSFLSLHAVSKVYGPVEALRDIDLSVGQGTRTAIIGPSGSGKTTLLRLIAGFERPDAGGIALDGAPLANGAAYVPPHRRNIGLVMQDGALFPHLTIAENIGFGLPRDRDRATRIAELLEMVGLERPMLARKPDQLSGGQQQRVALARALAMKPRLMLLDEPFSALDAGLRSTVRAAVSRVLGEAGITTILVTHDQAEAMSFADQIAVLRAGRLEQAGSPRELYLRPSTVAIAELLGQAIVLTAGIRGGWADCELGKVRVDDPDFVGRARILLRPEQIRLVDPEPAGEGSRFVVESVDFFGGWSDVTIRLVDGAPERRSRLTLRQLGAVEMQAGSLVRAATVGHAHRFRDSDRLGAGTGV